MLRVASSLLAVTAFAPMASAQSLLEVIAPVMVCKSEADDAARLACFDEAAAGLGDLGLLPPISTETSGGEPNDDQVIPSQDADAVTASRDGSASFGGEQLPSSRPDPDDVLREVSVRVTKTERTALGKLIFTTEDEQIWRQLDADGAQPRVPRSDEPYSAVIRRGSFGSYRLLIEGRRPAVRVRRVQ